MHSVVLQSKQNLAQKTPCSGSVVTIVLLGQMILMCSHDFYVLLSEHY